MDVRDYRTDYAAYSSSLELALYQHRAGFEPELELRPIYDRYGHLFTHEAIQSLEQALNETPEFKETERAGLKKLADSARIEYLNAQARELTGEIARCTSAQTIEWDDQRLPLNTIPRLIANEPIVQRRREVAARWNDSVSRCDDLRVSRLESFRNSLQDLGVASYRALFAQCSGVDFERLGSRAQELLEWTEPAYLTALSRATKRDLPDVAFEDLEHADYLYFQRMPHLDRYFAAHRLIRTYDASMRRIGINVGRQTNIHIDDALRPLKHLRAACFRIDPPKDVRLLIASIGGVPDYTDFFHQAGHAQHYAWSSRELVSRHPEFLYAPDPSTSESYAFLLSNLFLDASWLIEYGIAVDRSHARDIVCDIALVVCSNVRRRCGSLNYELKLHASDELRSDRSSAFYAEQLTQATAFRHEQSHYLTDVDDGFCSATYLRAWAFEAHVREYLRTKFGSRWWASKKCGDELIDLWNTASRYTVEELASHLGLGEITFDLLAENLITAMKQD